MPEATRRKIELDEETKIRIRKMLLSEQKEFEKELTQGEEVLETSISSGRIDVVEGNGKRVTTLRKCLKKIGKALKRLDEGTYGICENCGQSIHLGRLAAVPFTEYCLSCKNLLSNGGVGARHS